MLGIRTRIGQKADGVAEVFGLMCHPDAQKMGLGRDLLHGMSRFIAEEDDGERIIHFALGSARGSQSHVIRLCADNGGFVPVGVEPAVYTWEKGTPVVADLNGSCHEHLVHMCKLSPHALQVRRRQTNDLTSSLPPFAKKLAEVVLRSMGIPFTSNQHNQTDIKARKFENDSLVLPVSISDAMMHDAELVAPGTAIRLHFATEDGQGKISGYWNAAHSNFLVDTLQIPEKCQMMRDCLQELCLRIKEGVACSIATPLSIVFMVGVDQTNLIKLLEETVGCIPVAYYPAFLSSTGASATSRLDVVRYVLMPNLRPEQHDFMPRLNKTRLNCPERNGWMHAVFRTIKQSLLDKETIAEVVPFAGYPKTAGELAYWPWRQFGWEQKLEAHTQQITQELKGIYAETMPVRVWGQKINPALAWRKYPLTFTGLDILDAHEKCPVLSSLLKEVPNLLGAEFSVLPPGRIIEPHENCVFPQMIRSHLPLIVPAMKSKDKAVKLVVDDIDWHWKVGELVTFDDVKPHWACNLSDELRVVLILDVLRPNCGKTLDFVIRQQWARWFTLLCQSATTKQQVEFTKDPTGHMITKEKLLHLDEPGEEERIAKLYKRHCFPFQYATAGIYPYLVENDQEKEEALPGVPWKVVRYVMNAFYSTEEFANSPMAPHRRLDKP